MWYNRNTMNYGGKMVTLEERPLTEEDLLEIDEETEAEQSKAIDEIARKIAVEWLEEDKE